MSQLTSQQKHDILIHCDSRREGETEVEVAARHGATVTRQTIWNWRQQWNGTPQSLEHKSGAGRPRLLTPTEVHRYVRLPIKGANRTHTAINYTQLLPSVQSKTHKQISIRTLRRVGKEQLDVKYKHTRKRTRAESLRRKLRHIGTNNVIFLDETHLRLSEAPNHTLVLPDQQPFVEATETSQYSGRWDMIAACVGDRVLLPRIFSPTERGQETSKGINRRMLLTFIDDVFAQVVEGLNRYPLTLVLDRASIHLDIDIILQAFHDRGSQSIKEILIMPPNAAKRLSPLDNSLFHDWKEEVRKRCPATKTNIKQIMNDAWEKMKPQPHYRHCGLTRSKDLYFDCPDPTSHQHES